jgi:glycerophosphoryl diester phosphodiesterase
MKLQAILFVLISILLSGVWANSIRRPLLLAHRGSPFIVPEHTLASYAIAMREGADYIEPDLVFTKDGHLVCVHDVNLDGVTDVASRPEFASRNRSVTLRNGKVVTGWMSIDFTLEEIKTLRAKQRKEVRETSMDGLLTVPTFREVLDLLQKMNRDLKLDVGIYIETKHPTFFEEHGYSFDNLLLNTLEEYGYKLKGPEAAAQKIFLQSFENQNLIRLRKRTDIKLIKLIDSPCDISEDDVINFNEYLTPERLDKIATFANGIGPDKQYFMTPSPYPNFVPLWTPGQLIDEAHKRNLEVHIWTLRNEYEDRNLPTYFNGDKLSEYLYFYELGVDGVFTEFMPAAFEARNVFIESQHQSQLFAQRVNEQQTRLDQVYSVDLTKFEVVVIALACAIGGLIIGVFLTYVVVTQKSRAKEPVFSLKSLPSVKKMTTTKKH